MEPARRTCPRWPRTLWELEARRARLQAERDGEPELVFPEHLTALSDPAAQSIVSGERRFFQLRQAATEGQKRQLREQIAQLKEQIGGMGDQLTATKQEAALVDKELVGVQQLWDQRLVQLSRLSALQRDAAKLLGERGQLTASMAEAKGKISETELKILQIDQDFRANVAKELADIRAKYAEMFEKQIAARDQTEKLEIRAPQAGVVHDLTIHTQGGVIAPGETIMTIVPDRDSLIVENSRGAAGHRPGQVRSARRYCASRTSTSAPRRRSTARSPGSAPTSRATTSRARPISWCGSASHPSK